MEYLLKNAEKFGIEDIIEFDADRNMYFPTQDFEMENIEYVEEYSQEVFWDNLCDRLIHRDLLKELGETKLEKITRDEYFELFNKRYDIYADEFSEHGLDNIEIKGLKKDNT